MTHPCGGVKQTAGLYGFLPFEQLDAISPRPENAKEPKELHVIEGATHIDLHDRPQFVAPAVESWPIALAAISRMAVPIGEDGGPA